MIQDALQPALEAFGVWLQLKKTSKGFVNVLYKHRGLRCSLHTHYQTKDVFQVKIQMGKQIGGVLTCKSV